MTPREDPSNDPFEEERRIREALFAGLDQAVESIPDVKNTLTDTKKQKLVHFAVRDLDLSLTHAYYLAGDCGALRQMGSYPGSQPQNVPGFTLENFDERDPTEVVPRNEKVIDLGPYDPDAYKEYFQTQTFFGDFDLKEVILTKQHKFLIEYYDQVLREDDLGGDELADLYIQSTKLRKELRDLPELITTRPLTAFTGGGSSVLSREKELEIRRIVSRFHRNLARVEFLQENKEPVITGTDFIERVLKRLTHVDTVTEEQIDSIANLERIFYEGIWKYPALIISIETATGPNATALISHQEERLEYFAPTLEWEISVYEDDYRDLGLMPVIDDYRTTGFSESKFALHDAFKSTVRSELCRE